MPPTLTPVPGAMQSVTAFVSEKAQNDAEWLHREPRETHPAIVATVRLARENGLRYDDETVAYVGDALGIAKRNQLAHEVYIAKGQLRDEESRSEIAQAEAEGYEHRQVSALPDGRYLMRFGTTYVGQSVPAYGEASEYRIRNGALYRKHARTGYGVTGWALCKAVSA